MLRSLPASDLERSKAVLPLMGASKAALRCVDVARGLQLVYGSSPPDRAVRPLD
jgi:hypothetical protein